MCLDEPKKTLCERDVCRARCLQGIGFLFRASFSGCSDDEREGSRGGEESQFVAGYARTEDCFRVRCSRGASSADGKANGADGRFSFPCCGTRVAGDGDGYVGAGLPHGSHGHGRYDLFAYG